MNCRNCGHTVDGKFCSNCGQNSKVGRINLPAVLNEFSESIFQINKGFFYTLRELCIRPGESLKEFLNGKRKNHFKPIAYLLTLSTLYFLITQATNQNTWIEDLITGWMNGATEPGAKPASKPAGARKNPSALRSRLARVEKRMGELAQLAKDLDGKLADPALYGAAQRAQQMELMAQRARVAQETDEVEAEWLQVSEELEQLAG